MKIPIKIAVTGAAGNIGYSLLFRIASGEMLGQDQPVILQLLDLPQVQNAVKGIIMELYDCAFPLLENVFTTDDSNIAFKDVQIAILVGSSPRLKGMERSDLLESNSKIFISQGKALNEVAHRNVKVLVVGNPANTNAYIAMKSAPDLPKKNFTAMLRLDHNRAISQLALKLRAQVVDIQKMFVWGNHSSTMYADYRYATYHGENIKDLINDYKWYKEVYLPKVAQRGVAIIEVRGLSSAASAANAVIDHIRDWVLGTDEKWVTMGIPSDGSYGVEQDIICGFPVTCENGQYNIVPNLELDDFSQEQIAITLQELEEEKKAVYKLLNI